MMCFLLVPKSQFLVVVWSRGSCHTFVSSLVIKLTFDVLRVRMRISTTSDIIIHYVGWRFLCHLARNIISESNSCSILYVVHPMLLWESVSFVSSARPPHKKCCLLPSHWYNKNWWVCFVMSKLNVDACLHEDTMFMQSVNQGSSVYPYGTLLNDKNYVQSLHWNSSQNLSRSLKQK